MFAQESVMEIQNEREAFERFKAKQIGIDYETLKKDLDDCEKRFPNNRYAGWNFKSDWELWQAATAQAVPEWISVKYTTPPTDETVLVCWDYHPDVEPEKEYITLDEDLNEYWPNCEAEPPTHWKLIPKPPKAQEQSHE